MADRSAQEMVKFLQGRGYVCDSRGDLERTASEVRPCVDSTGHSLSFVRDIDYLNNQRTLEVRGIVIAANELSEKLAGTFLGVTWILTASPEAAFYELLRWMIIDENQTEIHQTAVIHPSAQLGNHVSIGPLSFIGPNVVVGDRVRIGAGCSLRHSVLGDAVVLQDGIRLGGEQLGAVKQPDGTWIDRPSLCGVRIDSGTRVDDNTVIHRGFMSDTHIHENVRIGANCFIGNGVVVHRGSLIAPGVVMAGGVQIGENCTVWSRVAIREGSRIEAAVTIGIGSVVLTNLTDGATYVGIPARQVRQGPLVLGRHNVDNAGSEKKDDRVED